MDESMVSGESLFSVEEASYVKNPSIVIALTNREINILRMLAEGLSNMEIGGRLELTEAMVKYYLFHLYKKIGIKRRTQAIGWARTCKIID